MYTVVTGAAGFIGANLVRALNARGERNIIAVDDLTDGPKFRNLVDCDIAHYVDKDQFIEMLLDGVWDGEIRAILHQGACSDTMEHNGKFMMENNYQYSVSLLEYCQQDAIPLLYASSAAVYGGGQVFREERGFESPLNVYGYSKFLFDQVVRKRMQNGLTAQVAGFRYFNVYGPREQHKGRMASVAFHLFNQVKAGENPKLFSGSENFKRDFIYVGDVAAVNLWFWQNGVSGIFNCGTGRAETFQAVADAVVEYHQSGAVEYIEFPEKLKGRYQAYTQADQTKLRAAGYSAPFKTVAEGVKEYMAWLNRTA